MSSDIARKIARALDEGPFKIAKLARKISNQENTDPILQKIADASKFWSSQLSFLTTELALCFVSIVIGYFAWCIIGDNALIFYTYSTFAFTCTLQHTVICALKSQNKIVTVAIGAYVGLLYTALTSFAYFNFTQKFNDKSIHDNLVGPKFATCVFASVIFVFLASAIGFFLVSMFRNQSLTTLMKEYISSDLAEIEGGVLEAEEVEEVLDEVAEEARKIL